MTERSVVFQQMPCAVATAPWLEPNGRAGVIFHVEPGRVMLGLVDAHGTSLIGYMSEEALHALCSAIADQLDRTAIAAPIASVQ